MIRSLVPRVLKRVTIIPIVRFFIEREREGE